MKKETKTIEGQEFACPKCQAKQSAKMPEDACQHFYKCQKCGEMLSPKKGDCCVFCSYADTKCPPKLN